MEGLIRGLETVDLNKEMDEMNECRTLEEGKWLEIMDVMTNTKSLF